MTLIISEDNDPYEGNLKKLIYFRFLFAFFLTLSTIVYWIGRYGSEVNIPILVLMGLCCVILLISVFYFVIYRFFSRGLWLAYLQLCLDTCFITCIVLVTGSFFSVFSFMYLILIIYSSILVSRAGCLVVATLSIFQYAVMIFMEYNGLLQPFGLEAKLVSLGLYRVLYKTGLFFCACYAIGFLGSILSEKERAARKKILKLEKHVKRMEKVAAVGEMAAGLAHEIRNPLASLTGAIQMINESMEYDNEQGRLMQIIMREGERLNTLVSDFLSFARPRTGKKEPVCLDRSIEETIELFERDPELRGRIVFEKSMETNQWIEMDEGHLRQVLWNLFLNAVQASDGKGIVRVNLSGDKKGSMVFLEIEDNGCGMDDKTMKSIFLPFFTTRTKGTGLGLPIVNRIIDQYDMELDVESIVGKGSVFTLKLKQVPAPSSS